jgi:hypothetical protein
MSASGRKSLQYTPRNFRKKSVAAIRISNKSFQNILEPKPQDARHRACSSKYTAEKLTNSNTIAENRKRVRGNTLLILNG